MAKDGHHRQKTITIMMSLRFCPINMGLFLCASITSLPLKALELCNLSSVVLHLKYSVITTSVLTPAVLTPAVLTPKGNKK